MTEKHLLYFEEQREKERPSTQLFKYICQRNEADCAVACLAMANDWDYWDARDILPFHPTKGVSGDALARALGLRCVKYRRTRRLSAFIGNGLNMILLTRETLRDKGHFILKDANDFIYDPDDTVMTKSRFGNRYVMLSIELP